MFCRAALERFAVLQSHPVVLVSQIECQSLRVFFVLLHVGCISAKASSEFNWSVNAIRILFGHILLKRWFVLLRGVQQHHHLHDSAQEHS